MNVKTWTVLGILLCSAPVARGSSWFLSEAAPEALEEAHEAFLSRDYERAVIGVKRVFEEKIEDPLVVANALALYERTLDAGDAGVFPAGTELPAEIKGLDVSVGRRRKAPAERQERLRPRRHRYVGVAWIEPVAA